MSSEQIKSVALAGATGALGKHILEALVASKAFDSITVLTRDASKASGLPAGVTAKQVDYASLDSLTAALAGIDAVVNANNQHDPAAALRFVDAAAAAGVRRYVPPDFGQDPDRALIQDLPVWHVKRATQKHLQQKAAEPGATLTYTIVSNGAFLDWGLNSGFMGYDLRKHTITLFEDGSNVIPLTNLADVAHATVQVLRHPAATRNRTVHVHTVERSQKQLADLLRAAVPGAAWHESRLPVDQAYVDSLESVKAGDFSWPVLAAQIQYSITRPEGTFLGPGDNDLLGVREIDDEELKQQLKKLYDAANA